MSKGLKFIEADLSAIAMHLAGYDCVIDGTTGIFIAKLPTREEGYRIIVHPNSRLIHEKSFGKGMVEIAVKRG